MLIFTYQNNPKSCQIYRINNCDIPISSSIMLVRYNKLMPQRGANEKP